MNSILTIWIPLRWCTFVLCPAISSKDVYFKYLYEIQVKWEHVVSCILAAFVLLHDFEFQSPCVRWSINLHSWGEGGGGSLKGWASVGECFSGWKFTLLAVMLPLKGSGLPIYYARLYVKIAWPDAKCLSVMWQGRCKCDFRRVVEFEGLQQLKLN